MRSDGPEIEARGKR